MSFKIGSDINRFKDIVRGRVKNDLKKFVSVGHMLGKQGKDLIKIPLHSINLPRFTFGRNGGMGQGMGDIGDPIDGEGKPGKGQAGDNDGDHGFETEFSEEELAQILIEHLELPFLENKKGKILAEKDKLNRISHQGPESLRHNMKSYKQALRREISSGTYNPSNPKIIPIKDDKRYRSYSAKEAPDTNTAVIYMIDCSGSMGDEQRDLVKAEVFWIDLLLKASYKDIESVYMIHDVKAQEVSQEDFFKISTGGGTRISSAYDLCSNIMEKRYPFSDWNVYPMHFTDSDNLSEQDSVHCCKLLKNKILPNCNVFNFGEVKSPNGTGDFTQYLETNFANSESLTISKISGPDDILKSIGEFFKKGK